MKRFNNFMNTAPYWQVYLFGAIFTGLITYIAFTLLGTHVDADNKLIKPYIVVQMSICFGAVFGVMICLTTSMARASMKFWKKAEEVEKKLDTCNTLDSLKELYNTDFDEMVKLGSGEIHCSEMRRIQSMISLKIKMLSA